MTWQQHEPTPAQIEQTKKIEQALCHELNLFAREGIPPAVLLTALGTVIADLITTQKGIDAVAPWFIAQGRMIDQLTRPAN